MNKCPKCKSVNTQQNDHGDHLCNETECGYGWTTPIVHNESFKCSCGHEWQSVFTDIVANIRCPKCDISIPYPPTNECRECNSLRQRLEMAEGMLAADEAVSTVNAEHINRLEAGLKAIGKLPRYNVSVEFGNQIKWLSADKGDWVKAADLTAILNRSKA